MILKINKVIRITTPDGAPAHSIETFESDSLDTINLTYGDPQLLMDPLNTKKWPNQSLKYHYHDLFPKDRVNPIELTDVTPETLIILIPKTGTVLFDTKFSEKNIFKEVLYSKNYKRQIYLFSGFSEKRVRIIPKSSKDTLKLTRRFKKDLTDFSIRKVILDLLSLKTIPETFDELLAISNALKSVPYIVIEPAGRKWKVTFNDLEYLLPNSESVNDILAILKYRKNLSLDEIKKISDQNRKKDFTDKSYLIGNWTKYKSRLKERCRETETEEYREINEDKYFSTFIEDYIDITERTQRARCEIPKDALIYFVEDK